MQITQSIVKSLDRLQNEPGSKGLLENVLVMSLVTLASTASMSSVAMSVFHACSFVGKILATFIV